MIQIAMPAGTTPAQQFGVIQNAFKAGGPGIYELPPGQYGDGTGGLVLPNSVHLAGGGRYATFLNGIVTVPDGATEAGLRDLCINGPMNNNQANTLTVGVNAVGCTFSRIRVMWGNSAIYNQGCDSYFEDMIVTGAMLANLTSTGACWYHRCKFDGQAPTQFGYYRLATSFGAEETFSMCDFSGAFANSAVCVSDATNTAAIKFVNGCVIGGPVAVGPCNFVLIAGSAVNPAQINCPNPAKLILGTNYPA